MPVVPRPKVGGLTVFVTLVALYALLPSCSPQAGGPAVGLGSSGDTTTEDSGPANSEDASTASATKDAAAFPDVGRVSTPGTGADAGCGAGMTLCSGQCTSLQTDAVNCGTCGSRCAAGQVCQAGACGCRTGETVCSATCVDTTSDVKNCGACGTACATGTVCSASKCANGCGSTLTLCGSSCVDTTGNSLDCGACGKACPSDQFCYAGACQCAAGMGACGTNGACVDITTSAQHCGSCTACPTGGSCVPQANAASTCACPAGDIVCANACVNPASDGSNCGTCGTTCGAGTQCLDGACINPTSVNCGGGAMVGNTCVANGFVSLGQYWANNNQWGVAASGTSGQQCVWGTCQTGDLVGWGTSWNWTNASGGVKTYASIVFGWQYGFKVTNTGLPVLISTNPQVNCGWDFTVSQTGTLDVSYDTWLHPTDVSKAVNDGANTTPSEEIMIWLYEAGGAGPISATGKPVASNISLAGATWNLYQGPGGSTWPVSSYVRTSTATTAVMNMMVFYNDLVTRGWIPNTRYLSSIQAGTEVTSGSGSLTTNGFYCRVQ